MLLKKVTFQKSFINTYGLSSSKHTFLKIIYLILDPFERISKIFNVVKFPVSISKIIHSKFHRSSSSKSLSFPSILFYFRMIYVNPHH